MALDLRSNKIIPASPSVKRQKTATGYNTTLNATHDYNGCSSENHICDDIAPVFVPDTPVLQTKSNQVQARLVTAPQAASPNKAHSQNHVQVPVSSPLSACESLDRESALNTSQLQWKSPSNKVRDTSGFRKSNGMSVYRPLNGLVERLGLQKSNQSKFNPLDNEDGPAYQGGSSEDEVEEINPNILPASFFRGSGPANSGVTSHISQLNARFKNIVQSAIYKGTSPNNNPSIGSASDTGIKRCSTKLPSIDLSSINTVLSSSHPSRNGPTHRTQIQARSEKAQPISDIPLDEISDNRTRINVNRIRSIYPSISIVTARNALLASNGSFDNAVNILADGKITNSAPSSTKVPIISLIDDDESENSPPVKKPEPRMKRTLNVPAQSIRDKYSSTQTLQPKYTNGSYNIAAPKHKKSLARGRRNPSPNACSNPSSPIKPRSIAEDQSATDTDSENNRLVQEEDDGLEARVLEYLNSCKVPDLIELTNITKENAETILAARPFKTISDARAVQTLKLLKSGKKSTRAPIGDRIVDTTIDMFRGYEAIDMLVSKCDELSQPLREEMSQWGFDIFGAQKGGELEITSLDEAPIQDNSSPKSPNSRAASSEIDDEIRATGTKRKNIQFLRKPELMAEDCVLKDYQIVGLNWLALMYRKGLSGILADEMGLGKTCQVISFLAHLVSTGNNGPHLVVCPGSTLENWLREIKRFAPQLSFEPYHGPLRERQEMADAILQNRDNTNVVVTTYDMAARKEDSRFMRRLKPDVCVYDEGHMLKNVKSQRYQCLIKIPARFRLLLTGTPLQNNLQELAALLAFILPNVFKELEEDLNTIFKAKATTSDSDHGALLSAQRIARARSMLTPFVLRRKKAQVLKHLPAKHCRTEYCALHYAQKEIYDGHLNQARERARIRLEGGKIAKSEENNPLMQLRKAAIHPLLFRRHFDDTKIEIMADILRKNELLNFPSSLKREHLIAEMQGGSDFWLHQWCRDYPCIAKFDIPDLAWMDSGKVESMMKLIKNYKENGDRVLLFSQFSLVLDIIEAVLNTSRVDYTRIDGSTKIDERQSLIDAFRDDESITVFLLTTKAGGTGINLMCANKVIIFDGSFNPQDDKQAENRAHRVGQTREVEVIRLVTRGTVEEQILALGDSKLQLDGRVAGDEDAGKAEAAGEKAVARMFLAESGYENSENLGSEGKDNVKVSMADEKKKPGSRKKKTIMNMLTQEERSESKD